MLTTSVALVSSAEGQRRDTVATKADSLRADSARAADSLAVLRELEKQARPAPTAQQGQGGPTNPRLLPDISAVGDLIGDLSPKGSTSEGGTRFGIREVEVALQAAVDPYFRGDIFLGISDEEGVAIEQAYLTATLLPWLLEVRLGRFLLPFGKQNTTHRHDLHTIEYPYVLQQFLGPEGLKATGVYSSRVFSPFGFYQELIVTAADRLGEAPEDATTAEPVNKTLGGLAYSARLRNYWDLSQNANIEVSASALTGRREQPVDGAGDVNAVAARQSLLGADVTFRWRPLQQGLYRSFILQGEVLQQVNERNPALPPPDDAPAPEYLGPTRNFSGWYAFARWQVSRRGFLGGRVDALQDPVYDGGSTRAASAYFEFFPSDFSKLLAGYERLMPPGGENRVNRIVLQATFALGPHKPHPF